MESNGEVFQGNADLSNSFETTNQKHVDFDGEDKSDIPMVVFSPPKQEEEPAKDATFSDCEDDCELFFPNRSNVFRLADSTWHGMVFKVLKVYSSMSINRINYSITRLLKPETRIN